MAHTNIRQRGCRSNQGIGCTFCLAWLCCAGGCSPKAAIDADRTTAEPDAAAAQTAPNVTFHKDVAPIVWQHCAPCHREGQSAPFGLVRHDDLRQRAEQIVDVISSGYMPPWLPAHGYVEFVGDRRLTEQQVDVIRQWAATGTAAGDPNDRQPEPTWPAGWQLGTPDLIAEMPEPYILPAEGRDVFRNFIVPVDIDSTRYVKAVEIQPGDARLVHHGVLLVDNTGTSRWLDAEDDAAGFDGMETGEAHSPDGHFPSWTPGKQPRRLPAGMAWRLESGDALVLQLHLLPSGKPESIQARIGLFFTDEPPSVLPEVLRLGSKTLDIPAGVQRHAVVTKYTLPVDVDALAVYPHAHYLGKSIHAFAKLPSGERRWLIRIDDWDFNWQDEYTFAKPIRLPRGAEIEVRFTYDNSTENPRNPHRPARRIVWGPQSSDEMGDLWLQVLPGGDQERAVLRADFAERELQESIACFRQLVEVTPDDARSHDSLGVALARSGDAIGAQRHFEKAIEISPRNVKAHFHLGLLWGKKEAFQQATAQFLRTLELDPDYIPAHVNLATVYFKQGQHREAEAHLQEAIKIRPDDGDAHYNLAHVCFQSGDMQRAERHLLKALQIRPDDQRALRSLKRLRGLETTR